MEICSNKLRGYGRTRMPGYMFLVGCAALSSDSVGGVGAVANVAMDVTICDFLDRLVVAAHRLTC